MDDDTEFKFMEPKKLPSMNWNRLANILAFDAELASDREDFVTKALIKQGASSDDAQQIIFWLKSQPDKCSRQILTGWCFQKVCPEIGVHYPHVQKQLFMHPDHIQYIDVDDDDETLDIKMPAKKDCKSYCFVCTSNNPTTNTNTHYADCLISDFQKSTNTAQNRAPLRELRRRFDTLFKTLFVESDYNRPLLTLCDTGADTALIQRRCIPNSIRLSESEQTLNGICGQSLAIQYC